MIRVDSCLVGGCFLFCVLKIFLLLLSSSQCNNNNNKTNKQRARWRMLACVYLSRAVFVLMAITHSSPHDFKTVH